MEAEMGVAELLFLAVGLSMDAFAVSICKGLSIKKIKFKHSVIAGLYFGIFQAGMPLIGYMLGIQFKDIISSIDHWIAFGLLGIIGLNMIREARHQEEDIYQSIDESNEMSPQKMLILAVATSIDALAIGVTFAFLNVNIISAVSIIGTITFFMSALGIKIGNIFGSKYKSKAEFAGGFILILLGIKILAEHLWM